MRTRRLAFGLLPPIALVLLLGALATLQYRWLGQVSEAERSQMRESLEQRVQAFSEDFDRELAHAFLVFQAGLHEFSPTDPAALAARHEAWQTTARFPDMIRAFYVLHADGGERTLLQYQPGPRTLEPVAWPPGFAPIRDVEGRPMSPFDAAIDAVPEGRMVVLTSGLLLPEVPAVVVPIPGRSSVFTPIDAPRGIVHVVLASRADASSLILELDRAHIGETVLPALAGRHVLDTERYDLAIVDARGETIFRRGDGDRPLDPAVADARAPLFLLRFEPVLDIDGASGGAPGSGAAPVLPGAGRMTMVRRRMAQGIDGAPEARTVGGHAWLALIRHAAGSLDAAVAEARRRNLWLSFGILAVLAASVGLIVVNARRSERLAAQQIDFVAAVSHELRTPLAVIRSAAQNLASGVVHDPDRAGQYGELIESEGRRLTDMVEHVLEYAGMDAHRRPLRALPVDCGVLVRDVVSSHRALPEAGGFTLALDLAGDAPPALADEDAVRRAVQNLIANALKHGADARWIGVSVRRGGTRGHPEVQVSVSDRGCGIDGEELRQIFEPFYRGRHAVAHQIPGNGLGLSLVRRIAEAHGGRVTVQSTSGGSTFTLHLPAAPPEPALATGAEPAADGRGRPG